ncbi:Bicarbonate transport ATP-binding protein CmpD OS=Afipia felis OX=1035 GN=cmpD_1 PE=3 SV=1 [Afipia felis]
MITDAPAQIRIQGVSKVFPGRGAQGVVTALADVNLDIRAGEFLVLLGPSGCGKSTLLNLIAGFSRISSGSIQHDGIEVTRPDHRRTVVFQEYALFPWKTVQENVEFGLKAQGVAKEERAKIARRLLGTVRLSGFENCYPHEISGGMKQRAAIARAIAPNPEVLLMDEPFGALDAQTRVLLQEEVARISAETKKTIIFVTHSIDEAVFLGDRIVVMSSRPGRIREIHDVDLPRPRVPEMRAEKAYRTLVDTLWRSLRPDFRAETGDVTPNFEMA